MVLREQQEEVLRQQLAALEKQRQVNNGEIPADAQDAMATDEPTVTEEVAEEQEITRYGSKIIVIHPGSQNLRLGFASDAFPKSIPNVIARRTEKAEFETEERSPKRVKLDGDGDVNMGDEDDDEDVGAVEKDPEVGRFAGTSDSC